MLRGQLSKLQVEIGQLTTELGEQRFSDPKELSDAILPMAIKAREIAATLRQLEALSQVERGNFEMIRALP